jgi:hypothetical protein
VLEISPPEGWTVRQTDDLVEIEPPDQASSVLMQLSLLRRERSDRPTGGEAVQILRGFPLIDDSFKALASEHDWGAIATGSCMTGDGRHRQGWLLGAKVWANRGVVFTVQFAPGFEQVAHQALRIGVEARPAD